MLLLKAGRRQSTFLWDSALVPLVPRNAGLPHVYCCKTGLGFLDGAIQMVLQCLVDAIRLHDRLPGYWFARTGALD